MSVSQQPSQNPLSDAAASPVARLEPLLSQASASSKGTQSHSQSARRDRGRYSTPRSAPSMTPPPSSQLEQSEAAALEVIPSTPNPHSQLSSPPPTVKTPYTHRTGVVDDGLYTPEQIDRATVDQLRDMIANLKLQVQDARTGMAHYKLQYTLLSLDSDKAANMMAMELAGAQREIEVLMEAEERRRNDMMTPIQSFQDANAANTRLLHEVTRRCNFLEHENEELKDDLERVQANLEHTEGQLSRVSEDNELLRNRIRANREHMNVFLDYVNERSPLSTMATPSATSRSRPSQRTTALENSQLSSQPFEALLLADKVLSQEQGATPSTPTRPRQRGSGHKRNAQSGSSLPATPKRARGPNNAVANPRTPVNATIPRTIPSTAPPASYGAIMHRRRGSSDSTITASSVDSRDAEDHSHRRRDDEIPESRASQVATSLLRSFSSSQKSNPAPAAKAVQSKLFGHVRKSNVSRPHDIDRKDAEPAAKKMRVDGSNVGLGIGLSGSPRR